MGFWGERPPSLDIASTPPLALVTRQGVQMRISSLIVSSAIVLVFPCGVEAQYFSDYMAEQSWNPPGGITISCTAGADYWSMDGDPLYLAMWMSIRTPSGATLDSWIGAGQGHIDHTLTVTVNWYDMVAGYYICNVMYQPGPERNGYWYLAPHDLRKDTIEGTTYWGLGDYRTDLTWQVVAINGVDWNAGGAPVNESFTVHDPNACNISVQTSSTYTNAGGRFVDCYGNACISAQPIPACQLDPTCETWTTQQIRVVNEDFYHFVRIACDRAEILR